jgi:hypothetical protein
MMNMLGDRLWNVPKDFQLRSPFESKGPRPIVPLTKALALMKRIEQDHHLHRYVRRHYTKLVLLYLIVTPYILITREYDSSV